MRIAACLPNVHRAFPKPTNAFPCARDSPGIGMFGQEPSAREGKGEPKTDDLLADLPRCSPRAARMRDERTFAPLLCGPPRRGTQASRSQGYGFY